MWTSNSQPHTKHTYMELKNTDQVDTMIQSMAGVLNNMCKYVYYDKHDNRCCQHNFTTGAHCCETTDKCKDLNKKIEHLWDILGDIPVNDDGIIDESYLNFPIGTDREKIWHWLETTFNISVNNLVST